MFSTTTNRRPIRIPPSNTPKRLVLAQGAMNSLTSSNPVDKTRENDVQTLIHLLLKEMPEFVSYAAKVPPEYPYQRMLLRGLMNLRSPMPLDPNFLALQDKLLQEELQEKGVIDVFTLPGTSYPKIALYQGDITKLKADAIVNAANSQLLGCFVPGHRCIDNAIHSAAGLQLREECAQIMRKQGHVERKSFFSRNADRRIHEF